MKKLLGACALVVGLGCGPEISPVTSGGSDLPGGGQPGAQARRAIEVAGGTVLAHSNGRFVVASDADRDRIWVADVQGRTIRSRITLPRGSEPNRLTEGPRGEVYVALRGSGKVVTLDVDRGAVTETRDACGEPRGLTFDRGANLLRLACGTGEVVSFPPTGAAASREVLAERDLRDVVVTSAGVLATTFRSAKLLPLSGSSSRLSDVPTTPLTTFENKPITMVPHAAWRSITDSKGRVVVLHQREVSGDIDALQPPAAPMAPTVPAYYVNQCNGSVVRSSVSVLDEKGTITSQELSGVLPVDVALNPKGDQIAVAFAGSDTVQFGKFENVSWGLSPSGLCAGGASLMPYKPAGKPTGVAFLPDDTVVVHTRVPAAIELITPGQAPRQMLFTSEDLTPDPGFDLFHVATNGVTCASCHMEGRDDGHVWTFLDEQVRTPTLAGGIMQTAPFHWKGELKDVQALVAETFVTRMGGVMPLQGDVTELGKWMDQLPRPAPSAGLQAPQIESGRQLFISAGCSGCHSGSTLTNDTTVDVGTGGKFQVPSLRGVSARAPFLHDGRAPTLRARFAGTGGGDKHGKTSTLTDEQLGDLTVYLQSL